MPIQKARYTQKLIVFFKPEDHEAVIALAQAREVSVASIVREALAAYMAQQQTPVGR